MKYRDLVSFEPIESVKVLRDAEDLEKARRDTETLVVSPRLAEQLTGLILPNMNLDTAPDAKGMLVVANYGTGKTHLMSVVSSILEHAELVNSVRSEAVREAAAPVGGRYRVIRAEIGATKMGLRDIITRELTDGLARLGVDFEFPDLSKVTNTKRSLEEMMAAFEAVHGDQGLLFVLDEMLDFLASRRDHELRVDLAVLREIGEICKSTRFRFIGGVQEAIFDNPRSPAPPTRSSGSGSASPRCESPARTSPTWSKSGCCARRRNRRRRSARTCRPSPLDTKAWPRTWRLSSRCTRCIRPTFESSSRSRSWRSAGC